MEFNRFTSTDALIVYSVYRPLNVEEVVGFKDIILFYDYINHDVLSYEELNERVNRLQAIGWLEVKQDGLRTTQKYHQWRSETFKNKKPPSVQKEIKEITTCLQLNGSVLPTTACAVVSLDRANFEKARQQYLSR